jgi:hypothetical protein
MSTGLSSGIWLCLVLAGEGLVPGSCLAQVRDAQVLVSTEQPDVGNGLLVQPVACPTNPRFLSFAKLEGESKTVFVLDEQTKRVHALTRVEKNSDPFQIFGGEGPQREVDYQGDFAWCPVLRSGDDRSWFAFVSDEGRAEPAVFLCSIGPDGIGRKIRVGEDSAPSLQPRWSPDGRDLVFVKHSNGSFNLFIARDVWAALSGKPASVQVKELTRDPGRESNPAWMLVRGRPYLVYERSTPEGETGIHWVCPTGGEGGPLVDEVGVWEVLPSPEPYHETLAYFTVQGETDSQREEGEGRFELRLARVDLASGRLDAMRETSDLAPYVMRSVLVRTESPVAWHPRGRYLTAVECTGADGDCSSSGASRVELADSRLWREGSAESVVGADLAATGLTFPRDVCFEPFGRSVLVAAQTGRHTVVTRIGLAVAASIPGPLDCVLRQAAFSDLVKRIPYDPGVSRSWRGDSRSAWILRGASWVGAAGAVASVMLSHKFAAQADEHAKKYKAAIWPTTADAEREAWGQSRDSAALWSRMGFIAGAVCAVGYVAGTVDAWRMTHAREWSGLRQDGIPGREQWLRQRGRGEPSAVLSLGAGRHEGEFRAALRVSLP